MHQVHAPAMNLVALASKESSSVTVQAITCSVVDFVGLLFDAYVLMNRNKDRERDEIAAKVQSCLFGLAMSGRAMSV